MFRLMVRDLPAVQRSQRAPRKRGERAASLRLAAIPGLPPLMACVALLLAWDMIARLVAIDSLPSPWSALEELPALLSDRESLLNILDSMRRMATGFVL